MFQKNQNFSTNLQHNFLDVVKMLVIGSQKFDEFIPRNNFVIFFFQKMFKLKKSRTNLKKLPFFS